MEWIKRIDYRRWLLVNFIVLALFGVILRYMQCFPSGKLNYLNILHAHSHFAFAGWIFLALALLIAGQIQMEISPAFKWILGLTLLCAFGMLFSFSVQGYKTVSIIFSTLFLLITYRFAYLVYNKWDFKSDNIISARLMKMAIACLVLSSIGPLALGALKASGNTGIVYQNAIYFYLHFQLNGWMLFGALGVFACRYLNADNALQKTVNPWLSLFLFSAIPLFFIFTLWIKPPLWVFFLALVGAFIHTISWFVLLKKLFGFTRKIPLLIQMALIAISLKVIFQVLVCVPVIGGWTFSNRNLIIGYIHLITLGCITPILLQELFNVNSTVVYKTLNVLYCMLTVLYLMLLFLQPLLSRYEILIPHFQYCLLLISVLFCVAGVLYYIRLSNKKRIKKLTRVDLNHEHSVETNPFLRQKYNDFI